MSTRKCVCIHLFIALDAELALHFWLSVYLSKGKHEDAVHLMLCAALSDAPINGTSLTLPFVRHERHVCGWISI